ncbi:retrotransposon nucleocapsid protein [Hirsutella rhossiliensis]|uniref:Retrotransposon nucleocapsid protein n=1 Tax=Hirsutella rhossiliensis TaxID=111463 RepID=A0A9P8MY38_9HYPO|nr:retrotransposon nucleocapsid protein [Hirsutella rhossiliensis]KAH0963324.1 retrotransposon nucleocapsid protein [Hirsutella rhossiliensis]
MSREELLVLRKTLKDLLDRGFIRASSSAAAAPVLFRDRYPLPLIAETLQNLAKAKWFTKLDVVAAFHKIRMAPGHEWKTAFRTSVLREWLDDFVTAYLDDVLIYSSGSKADHEAKVRKVLQALADAGLHLDPAKEGNRVRPREAARHPRMGSPTTEGPDGRRHSCAFFSKRLSPAEYNYPIHDKEMLAIMRCLDNWNAELRSCGPFTILTDHRNLEYFMTRQKLTERQSRWAAELSQFDFKLEYRPGSEAVVPDALSRREQDKPQGIDDEREQGRMIQLIPDSAIPSSTRACINAMSSDCSEASTLPKMKVFEVADLQQLWDETVAKDSIFRAAYKAVRDRERAFPPSLGLKIQISECAIDVGKRLTFRDRIWSHDSVATGHPGREGTLAIVARRFYWPGQSQLVRRAITDFMECHGPSSATAEQLAK